MKAILALSLDQSLISIILTRPWSSSWWSAVLALLPMLSSLFPLLVPVDVLRFRARS